MIKYKNLFWVTKSIFLEFQSLIIRDIINYLINIFIGSVFNFLAAWAKKRRQFCLLRSLEVDHIPGPGKAIRNLKLNQYIFFKQKISWNIYSILKNTFKNLIYLLNLDNQKYNFGIKSLYYFLTIQSKLILMMQ